MWHNDKIYGRFIMEDTLKRFNEIIDEEIEAYEALGELYKVKQSILVQGKSDLLAGVDAQIIEKAEFIQALTSKRKVVAQYFGDENLTMSQIIEKAKDANNNPALVEKLEAQKSKINILAKTLSLQEKTNLTLIQHSLTMVGKTLEIIVGAFLPNSNQYDKSGHNVSVENNQTLSSIIEEV